jgi:preprotein translocase subunit YajC
MSLFISDALAQAAPAASAGGEGGLMQMLITMGLFFAVFYFLAIRPQQKRAKEHKAMVEALGKGDEVVTQGGIVGRVSDLGENFIEVEIAEEVKVKIQRGAVSAVLPKGTIKTL